MEQTPIKNHQRQSSTAQVEESTNQRHIINNKIPRKAKHKSQSSQRQIPQVSQSQSMYIPEQTPFKQEQIKRGASMMDLKSKIVNLEGELLSEKKKCSKLRKLVCTKVEKEKQLDAAYKLIVRALQEKIDTQPSCFCKSKCSIQPQEEQSQITRVNITTQIECLKKENKLMGQARSTAEQNCRKLREEVQSLKRQNHALRESINAGTKDNQSGQNGKALEAKFSHLVILNKFYQNQVQKLHKEKEKLEQSLKKYQKIQNTEGNENEKALKGDMRENEEEEESKEQFVDANKWESHNNDENIFSTFRQSNPPNRISAATNRSKKSKPAKSKFDQLQSPVRIAPPSPQDHSVSYRTVKSLERDSFVSIYSDDQAEEQPYKKLYSIKANQESFASIAPLPGFEQMSSVINKDPQNKSELHRSSESIKQYFDQHDSQRILSSELINSIQRQQEKPQNMITSQCRPIQNEDHSYLTMALNLKKLVELIDRNLNQYLEPFRKGVDLSPIYEMFRQAKTNKKAPKNYLSDKWLEQVGSQIRINLREAQQQSLKQWMKDCNNLNLQLSEVRRNLEQIKQQKLALKLKNDNLMQYNNNKLEHEVAELGSSNHNQSMYTNQRSTFLNGVYRSKMTLGEPLFKQSEVLCRLISTEEFQSYQKFIEGIPNMLCEVLKSKINGDMPVKDFNNFDIDRNVESQFKTMIESVLSIVEKNALEMRFLRKKSESKSAKDDKAHMTNQKSYGDMASPTIKQKVVQQNIEDLKLESQAKDLDKVENILGLAGLEQFYQIQAENQQLLAMLKEKTQQIELLKEKVRSEQSKNNSDRKTPKSQNKIRTANKHRTFSMLDQMSRSGLTSEKEMIEKQDLSDISDEEEPQEEWKEASQIREYNNIKLDRDNQIRQLKNQINHLQLELQGYKKRFGNKRNKIYYINH